MWAVVSLSRRSAEDHAPVDATVAAQVLTVLEQVKRRGDTLLIMNNRTAWVGDRLRPSLALNLVLAAALVFFAFTGIREVMRLAG